MMHGAQINCQDSKDALHSVTYGNDFQIFHINIKHLNFCVHFVYICVYTQSATFSQDINMSSPCFAFRSMFPNLTPSNRLKVNIHSLDTLCLSSCMFLLRSTFSASVALTLFLSSCAVLATASFSLISSFMLRLRSNTCLCCSSIFSSAVNYSKWVNHDTAMS